MPEQTIGRDRSEANAHCSHAPDRLGINPRDHTRVHVFRGPTSSICDGSQLVGHLAHFEIGGVWTAAAAGCSCGNHAGQHCGDAASHTLPRRLGVPRADSPWDLLFEVQKVPS